MKPTEEQRTRIIFVHEDIPEEYLHHPCEVIPATENGYFSIETVGKGYTHNTLCVKQYKDLLNEQGAYLDRKKVERSAAKDTTSGGNTGGVTGGVKSNAFR